MILTRKFSISKTFQPLNTRDSFEHFNVSKANSFSLTVEKVVKRENLKRTFAGHRAFIQHLHHRRRGNFRNFSSTSKRLHRLSRVRTISQITGKTHHCTLKSSYNFATKL